ncbi:MAG: 50S ribosomal protein L21 [Candidatus Moranbacteria bacterium]|nr:50S ribosomal protein L21 [Candidatus Moranbacteria bacterium]
MLAVIQTGGKQYDVREGDKIEIEKLEGEVGSKVVFDQVLLLDDGKKVQIGKPVLENQEVEGKILEQKKASKIIIIKQKPKKRYFKKQGHAQKLTVVEITKV